MTDENSRAPTPERQATDQYTSEQTRADRTAADQPSPDREDDLRILLLADPGAPERGAERVRERLGRDLGALLGIEVQVSTHSQTLRISPENELDVSVTEEIAAEYGRVDLVLVLTEVPRHVDRRPLVAELFPAQGVGVLSLPTLGPWVTSRRLVRLLTSCAIRMLDGDTEAARGPALPHGIRWEAADRRDRVAARTGRLMGNARTVGGMVATNTPLRTAPRLSRAMAAASATGAFGVFYNSIWVMADRLSAFRLTAIAILAVLAMVGWLIVSNRLWDTPARERLASVVLLYNLSTVVTLVLCVTALYLLLVAAIVACAGVVIAPDYMTEILGREAGPGAYVRIGWLSAAMGVVAGGLGSSFDSETDLRRITHGQRERSRMYTRDD